MSDKAKLVRLLQEVRDQLEFASETLGWVKTTTDTAEKLNAVLNVLDEAGDHLEYIIEEL